MVNGISLAEFAAVLTGVAGILSAIFVYTKSQGDARDKLHEGRVSDLQKTLEEVRKDCDERISQFRADFERQLSDVKKAMVNQAETIERQEIMLQDQANHIRKLERAMAAEGMEIPEFETSILRKGNRHASP